MPIRFRCQDCRSRVKVPEGSQGKQVKCPRCGRIQSVPSRDYGSDHAGTQVNDLTVHTCVNSMHKAPKRKESLVASAGDRLDDYEGAEPGGGVPGGLDIPIEAGNGYQGNSYKGNGQMSRKKRRRLEAARARAAQEAEITESRKRVEDLFATSHDEFSSDNEEAVTDTQAGAAIVTKSVTRPQAIALDGGTLLTDQESVPDEAASQAELRSLPPVEDTEAMAEQALPATEFEPEQDSRWTLDLTAEAYPFLKMVPWVLRVAALALIGPAFKAMLVASDQGFSAVVCMLVLFAGLTLVAVTWTVGEIATAVRDIALRRVAG
jgi:phage FluMu protein Com